MSLYIINLLISRDKGEDLKIQQEDLTKCIKLINKELKTSKTAAPCLSISLRFTNISNMKKLNSCYSGINRETNVLSFLPNLKETDENNNLVGDIAICVDVLKKEAKEQNKICLDHLLHLFLHGVLHLMGFGHDSDEEALEMETLEKKILSKLGIEDPYQIEL